MRTCLLITGEVENPFTLNELPYLARAFGQVHLFALNAKSGAETRRELPVGVIVHPVGVAQGFMRVAKYAWRGLKRSSLNLPFRSLRPSRLVASLYARGRSDCVYRFILDEIDRGRIDCSDCVVYSFWFADYAIAASRVADELRKRGYRCRAYCRAHGYDLYWERNAAHYLPYQDVALEILNGVYPCSEYGARYLREKYPEYASKVNVARLGTRDCGLGKKPTGGFSFVTCCRMEGLKRMPLFAEAFCHLQVRRGDCRWYCIGAGDDLPMVKNVVSRNGLGSSVDFMGCVDNAALLDFYRRTPVSYFVNVSTTEGVPVTIMEALSFGIPVIATDVGGSGELVSQDCGFLIDVDLSVEKLESVLEGALNELPDDYQSKRKRARAVWEERASADVNYREWCKLLAGGEDCSL